MLLPGAGDHPSCLAYDLPLSTLVQRKSRRVYRGTATLYRNASDRQNIAFQRGNAKLLSAEACLFGLASPCCACICTRTKMHDLGCWDLKLASSCSMPKMCSPLTEYKARSSAFHLLTFTAAIPASIVVESVLSPSWSSKLLSYGLSSARMSVTPKRAQHQVAHWALSLAMNNTYNRSLAWCR